MKKLTFILAPIIACLYSCNPAQQSIKIPTIDEVGASMLPSEIKEVNAPFSFPKLSRPQIPEISIKFNTTGSLTPKLNQTIDSLSLAGGGKITLPEGTWTSGRIILKSNIELQIPEKTTIQFSPNVEDYLPAVKTRIEGIEVMSLAACIYAADATNIAITGNGKLIGPPEGEIRNRIMTHTVIENVVNLDLAPNERIHNGSNEDWIFPPMFIAPYNCKNVLIEGITLRNTAFWNIVPTYCENVIIRGVDVNSVGIARGDGIDIESSKNVLIEYCTLASGDDCFTLKAGRGEDGLRVNKATENVVIRYCLAREGHGGITCGSETAGMIKNLYVHDCVLDNTGVGIRFKTRRPRGGGGQNLTYERIRMNLKYTVLKWDMLGSTSSVGELANRFPQRPINKYTPKYTDITIKDILIEQGDHFLKIYGIPESPVANLTIENAQGSCKQFIIANDTKNVTISNSNLQIESDSLIQISNSQQFTIKNSQIKLLGGEITTQSDDQSEAALINNLIQ